jgi:ankyrin repeat protein
MAAAKLLLAQGACLDCGDSNGRTPLWYAADRGNIELVRLFVGTAAGDELARQADKDGYTALHRAALNGSDEIAGLLLAHGADVNAKAAGDNRPLMLGAMRGHPHVVRRLLAAGAEADEKNTEGNTALMLAAANGYRSVVETLLQYHANPALRNQRREQAIDLAGKARHQDIVSLLKQQTTGFW